MFIGSITFLWYLSTSKREGSMHHLHWWNRCYWYRAFWKVQCWFQFFYILAFHQQLTCHILWLRMLWSKGRQGSAEDNVGARNQLDGFSRIKVREILSILDINYILWLQPLTVMIFSNPALMWFDRLDRNIEFPHPRSKSPNLAGLSVPFFEHDPYKLKISHSLN